MSVNGESSTDRTVLAALFDSTPLTRPELASHTGLSRPTISDAVRRLGVSAPGVIHADGRTMSTAHNLGEDGPFDLLTPLEGAVDAPVVLDNNVNLAALGERWRGHARDVPTFAFLAVGAGIGMGL